MEIIKQETASSLLRNNPKRVIFIISTVIVLGMVIILLTFYFLQSKGFNMFNEETKTTTTLNGSVAENNDPANPDRTVQPVPSDIEEPNYVSAPPVSTD